MDRGLVDGRMLGRWAEARSAGRGSAGSLLSPRQEQEALHLSSGNEILLVNDIILAQYHKLQGDAS